MCELLRLNAIFHDPRSTPSGGKVYVLCPGRKKEKQAEAELCQAQVQVSFLAEAELYLTVEFKICVLLEKTYNYI